MVEMILSWHGKKEWVEVRISPWPTAHPDKARVMVGGRGAKLQGRGPRTYEPHGYPAL